MPSVRGYAEPQAAMVADRYSPAPIGQVTGQDAGGGLWIRTRDGQEIALPADRIDVRDGVAYEMAPQEVGLGGKALGALGLDLDGDRGRTSWSEAMSNSTKARGGRGNILPVDESGLAVPGMLAQPIEDFHAMSPQNSVEENSRLSFSASGLAPTVGFGASVAGAVPEGAVAAKGLFRKGVDEVPVNWQGIVEGIPHGVQPEAIRGQPFTARMYRGEQFPDDPARDMSGGLFASSSPAEASSFATPHGSHSQPRVTPLDVEFQNPYVVDKNGGSWETHYADLARARGLGHDGLVMQNVVENLGQNTTSVALKPGTVRSATTGDLIYSNSPTGASVPLLQRLLGQRGGQSAATDTGAMAQEMAALQQRHAELFGSPYRTPQPPGGATPETMAADLADLRARVQSKEQTLASQPQTASSVPAAGPPPAPSIPPAVQRQIDMKAEERPQLRMQSEANPYTNIRDPQTGKFLPKAERDRLVTEYNRRGDVEPVRKDTPWGAEPLDPMAYKAIAEKQQQYEAAKKGIVKANSDIANLEKQRAKNAHARDKGALAQTQKELQETKDLLEQYREMFRRTRPRDDE